jgi:hypothetical protein
MSIHSPPGLTLKKSVFYPHGWNINMFLMALAVSTDFFY